MNRIQYIIYHLCRLTLAGLFIYAGAVKMSDVVVFASHVAAYQLLPYAGNYLVASTLPYIEFLAGVLLLLNARIRPALLAIAVMLILFMLALLTVIVRGLEIDCGCFNPGSGRETSAQIALLRDFGLMALVVVIWHLRTRHVASV